MARDDKSASLDQARTLTLITQGIMAQGIVASLDREQGQELDAETLALVNALKVRR